MGCFWPPRAASPRYTKARRVAESRSATETMRGRSGLKIVAIGFSVRTEVTSHCRADLRRPPAHRFTLRVSATRRDTKPTRNLTKTQHGSLPRHIRPTFPSLSLFLFGRMSRLRIPLSKLVTSPVRQNVTVSNHVAFSCLFVRLSCPGGWPRPEDAPQSEARRVDCRRQRRSRPQGSA